MDLDIDIFIAEFGYYTGASGTIISQAGNGNEDRAFDIETSGTELYTAGQFGNIGQLQFPTAGNAPLIPNSNIYETYFARLDFSGTFFRKNDLL